MLKNLMFVTVYVSDQDRALAFYTEALGLQKCADNPTPWGRFLTVAAADDSVQIVLWPGTPGQGSGLQEEPGTVPGPIFLESDDLTKEFEALRSRGVSSRSPNRRPARSASASPRSTPTGTGSRSASPGPAKATGEWAGGAAGR